MYSSFYGLTFNPFDKQQLKEKDHFISRDFTEMTNWLNYPKDQLPSGGDLRLCVKGGRSGREMGGSQCHEDRYLRNGDHAGEAQSRGEGRCA